MVASWCLQTRILVHMQEKKKRTEESLCSVSTFYKRMEDKWWGTEVNASRENLHLIIRICPYSKEMHCQQPFRIICISCKGNVITACIMMVLLTHAIDQKRVHFHKVKIFSGISYEFWKIIFMWVTFPVKHSGGKMVRVQEISKL